MAGLGVARELLEQIRSIPGDKRALRRFGLVMSLALILIGALLLWRGGPFRPFALAAALFFLAALVAPAWLRPIQIVWMSLAIPMGWMMTRVILALVFFLAITPIALLGRMAGKRFLETHTDPSRPSYWEHWDETSLDRDSYRRQF